VRRCNWRGPKTALLQHERSLEEYFWDRPPRSSCANRWCPSDGRRTNSKRPTRHSQRNEPSAFSSTAIWRPRKKRRMPGLSRSGRMAHCSRDYTPSSCRGPGPGHLWTRLRPTGGSRGITIVPAKWRPKTLTRLGGGVVSMRRGFWARPRPFFAGCGSRS
jgi:hypothetical protein